MSEVVAHGADVPAPSHVKPAHGERRTIPRKTEGQKSQIWLALAILVPAIAAYVAILFGLYEALRALS